MVSDPLELADEGSGLSLKEGCLGLVTTRLKSCVFTRPLRPAMCVVLLLVRLLVRRDYISTLQIRYGPCDSVTDLPSAAGSVTDLPCLTASPVKSAVGLNRTQWLPCTHLSISSKLAFVPSSNFARSFPHQFHTSPQA